MGTKNDPGSFDCYAAALPDEPMFILLARDPEFYDLVKRWAERRQQALLCGDRPQSDWNKIREARDCACQGQNWRLENLGKWKQGE